MMHAYTKPEAEAQPEPTKATDVLADDLHSAISFENLRATVELQQKEISLLARSNMFLMDRVQTLTNNVVELTTLVSAAATAAAKDGAQ